MKELNFDTGLVSYTLNGKVEITFNPTDINFFMRLIKTFEELQKLDDERQTETKKTDTKDIYELSKQYDVKMRGIIDEAIGVPVCDAVFGNMNVFFSLANGLPVYCNMIMALLDVFPDAFLEEMEATNPRIQKYTEKYSRKVSVKLDHPVKLPG